MMGKRIFSLLLAAILLLGSPVSALAETVTEPTENLVGHVAEDTEIITNTPEGSLPIQEAAEQDEQISSAPYEEAVPREPEASELQPVPSEPEVSELQPVPSEPETSRETAPQEEIMQIPDRANPGQFAGGSGTAADPYIIKTKAHLNNVRYYLNAHFRMEADIVFTEADFASDGDFYNSGTGWQPIGTDSAAPFTGTFDGNGHTITGLKIHITSDTVIYVGLFGYIRNSTIMELGLKNSDFFVEKLTTASRSVEYIGGLVGSVYSSTITDCYITGNVTGTVVLTAADDSGIGGITCYAAGIAGDASYATTITGCYNAATVSVKVTATAKYSARAYAGGITGYGSANITTCYNTGNITAETASDVYYAETYIGGIAGYAPAVSNCYNTGAITGASSGYSPTIRIGGIAGRADGAITNSYNRGSITSNNEKEYNTYCGGIAGSASDNLINCYYLNTVNKGVGIGTDTAVACTDEQMKQQATYIGFDFDTVWTMKDGYPHPHSVRLQSVQLSAKPYMLFYIVGESLNLTGGEITLIYDNGAQQKMDISYARVTGFDNTRVGTQTLTVAFSGKTTSFDVVVYADDPGAIFEGAGTAEAPYIIKTKEQLNFVRKFLTAHYRLDADIVFTEADFAPGGDFYHNGTGWQPIGESLRELTGFIGTLDGNGHVIKGLKISASSKNSVSGGLFARTYQAEVRNLGMEACDIRVTSLSDSACAGGIAGDAVGGCIEDCYYTGSITAEGSYSAYAGGITGDGSADITTCYNTGSITAKATSTSSARVYAGGIAGDIGGALITDCYNTGNVTAEAASEASSSYNNAIVHCKQHNRDQLLCDQQSHILLWYRRHSEGGRC